MEMKTFNIEIQEFLSRIIEVEANDVNEAISIVEDNYKKCVHVLDYNDFVEVNFQDINTQNKEERKNELTKEIINYLYKNEEKHYEEYEEYNKPNDHIFLKLEELKNLFD